MHRKVYFVSVSVKIFINCVIYSIEYGDDLSDNLLDLFHKILDKNPDTRITMKELREHPWITNDGTETMLSEEDNCDVVSDPTEEEMNNAIKSIASIFAVVSISISLFLIKHFN
jgi:serine/threonine protein kinase